MTNPQRVVSSWVSWLITIVLSLTSALAHATTCDVDADGDIDRKDYLAILADIGERASGPNDPRDADRNGRILSNDAQLCARRCTLAHCDILANKAPIAKNNAATTALDTPVRINVIANDRDRDGRIVPRTVRIVTKPKHGKVTRHRDGTVTYNPALGFLGRDRFRYRVKDNDGATSNVARVRMTVESGNGLPMADAGSDFNAATGALVTLDGSNSSDPNGDPLTFSWQFLSVPPASTVTNALLANPATAAPSFTTDVDGPYALALEVSDGQMTDVDTVTVTAATANVPPNADAGPDQSALIDQVVDLNGQASFDPDAGPSPLGFRWFFVAVPPGSILTDGNITGAATALASFAPDIAGAFRVGLEVDDGADTDQDEVMVTVSPPNVPPNADAGTDIVVQLGNQTTLDGTASNDPDNGPGPLSFLWTFVSVPPGPPGSAITDADLSGATTATPSFTPDVAGFYLLRLDVTDGDLTDTDPAVMVKANVAPVAVNDGFSVVENTTLTEPAPGVLGNDTDGNSDPLTAALVTDVANGTLVLNADGSFTYTPDPDFEGTDGFTYLANDGSADSNVATVTLTITHANEAPVAVNDPYTTDEDTPLVVTAILGVLGNDTDFESDPLTAVVDTDPANGTLTLNVDGSFTYTPNPDFNGTDTFTYHANDGLSDSNVVTVSITVDAVNDVPSFTVGPDQTVLEGAGAQTVNPWATGISPGPADEASQTVSFNVSGNTNPGLFSAGPSVSAAGVLTYTPAADASGSATIMLTLADNGGTANGGIDTSASQGFTITVNDINDPPSFTAGPNQTVNEGAGPQTVNPWATAIDDGDPGVTQTLTFNVIGNTNAALFSTGPAISTAGVLTYTLAADANGAANITLTLSDGGGTANGGVDTSASQTFSITVNAVNDAPVFSAGPNQSVDEDSGAQSASGWASGISPGPADEAGQTVNFNITGNTNPSLFSAPPAVSSTGTLTYTPAPNAFGSATITLTLSDNGGTANGGIDTSVPQSFTITVNAVNDVPSFTAGPNQTANEDAGPQTVSPWATAIDDGEPGVTQTLTFNVTGNSNPTLFSAGPSISPTGVLTYTPAANASGTATITLTLSDDGGTANGGVDTSASQTFTITVNAVNDAPVFSAGPNQSVNEDASAQSVSPWATAIDDGDPESTQALTFNITGNTNASLFSAGPSVSPSGVLTYNPALNAFGSATITLVLQDDGGTTNGGVDTSAAQSFTITINAVNDAPSFTAGSSQSVLEDAGPQTVNPWATAISPGPANESGQTVSFNITSNTNPGLFSAGPTVSPAGVLTYTSAPNVFGSASIMLVIQDSGTTANGGVDTSGPQGFSITVMAVNDPPVATAKSHQTHSGILVTIGAVDTGKLKDGATDVDDPFGDLAVNAIFGSITPAGATITLTDPVTGTFTYNPPAGFSGAASFQFQVCDDGSPTPPVMCSAATTVSFTVTGTDLWFVQQGASGTGRLTDPFGTLASLPGGRGNGDRIFVFSVPGTGIYGTGHTLNTSEHLIGQGSSGSFDTVLGVQLPGNGTLDPRPALGGTRPQLNGTVTVGGSSVVRGLNINSTTATGLSGGAVAGVSVSEASVTSGTGTAVNLNGTGGAVGLTSVSANGAVNGIVLINTTGSFTVTGSGGNCTMADTTCTGGTIQSTTGSGVQLTSAANVSFTRMRIVSSGVHGINGSGVSGLTLNSSLLNANGNGDNEHGVNLVDATGTFLIDATTVHGAAEDLVQITNTNTNLALTVQNGSHFEHPNPKGSAFANSAILLRPFGSASPTVSVQGNTFKNVVNNSLLIGGDTTTSGTRTVTFSSNTVTVDAALNQSCSVNPECRVSGLVASARGTTTTNFVATGNTFTRASGAGVIELGSNETATLRARVETNNISNSLGDGVKIGSFQGSRMILQFNGNTLTNIGGDGFEVAAGESVAAASTDMDLVLTNNTINGHTQNPAIQFVGGFGIFRFGDADQLLCLKLTGNTVTSTPAGFFDVYLDGNFGALGGNITYEGAGTGAVTPPRIKLDNPGVTEANVNVSSTNLSNGVACQLPGI